ncbi:hypothetical protein KGF57_001929 [Candida theae]|uniref:Uncharacterized protein n=1 Tax=Candida theae TaxID=1198502 RepID=A0AAD5FZG8_9ASCO|nr:uncharacterized protein KGF57_001929 [Candida theae]KAI5960533.1 hypothetical protein KGF57_001929 [Candida theae]
MVSTGNTIAVFRTTMRAIFGCRKKDAQKPPSTISTPTSTAPTADVTLSCRFSSLQPPSPFKNATSCEVSSDKQDGSVISSRFRNDDLAGQAEEVRKGGNTKQEAFNAQHNYTRNIAITRHLLDVSTYSNQSTATDTSQCATAQWQLKLSPNWTEYVLVYLRLEYGTLILAQLSEELDPYIDFYQVLGHYQGIVVHFKDQKYQYWFLQQVNRVIGIQLVLSSPEWLYSVTNHEIINAFKEYSFQLVKYKKPQLMKRQKQVISLYGIPSFIPKRSLIEIFRQLGELISFRFAPTGPSTRFHVVKLQYAQREDRVNIGEGIKKLIEELKCKVVFKIKINNLPQQTPQSK